MITPDLLLSYWLLLWFIMYLLNIIKYSPKLWFIIALIYIIIITLCMYKKNMNFILLFILIAIVGKVIPLYIMRKDKYIFNDFLFGLLIVIFYLFWVKYRNRNVIAIYTTDLFNGEDPVMNIYKLYSKI